MLKYLMIAMFVLVGCGKPVKGGYLKHLNDVGVSIIYGNLPTAPKGPTKVNPELKAIWDDFQADAPKHNASLQAGLQDVDWVDTLDSSGQQNGAHTIGLCYWIMYNDGTKASHIRILKYPYEDGSTPWDPLQLRTTVYHELGHCLLGLEHTPQNSYQIMDPVVSLTTEQMEDNWTNLVNFEFASERK